MTRKISFHWWTREHDFPALKHSLASVRKLAPDASLYVHLDPAHPFVYGSDVFARSLPGSPAVDWSRHSHGGNLNGLDHIDQQLEAMVNECGTVAVKLDADTVVRGLDWLAPILDPLEHVDAVGFSGPPAPWSGPCYALKHAAADTLRATLAEMRRQGDTTLLGPAPEPEDATIYTLLRATKKTRRGAVVRFPSWPESAHFAGFQGGPEGTPWAERVDRLAAYAGIDVVTFGNRDSAIPPEEQAALMATLAAL